MKNENANELTREQKIKNIIDATGTTIETLRLAGKLTTEMHNAIIDNMNHIISLVK